MAKVKVQRKLYPVMPGEIGVLNSNAPYHDLLRFGARGNGVDDDTDAINEWLTYGKGNLSAPDGVFITRGGHNVLSNRRVTFGQNSIFKLKDFVGVAPVSVFQTEDNGTNIAIEGGIIDGNRANQSWAPIGTSNYGLVVRSSNTIVRGVETKNVTANGMGIAGATPVTRVAFRDCNSHHNGKKGFHSAKPWDFDIIGGWFDDNELDSGIGLHQGANSVTILSVHCSRNGTYGAYAGDSLHEVDSGSRRITIANSHFTENVIAGVFGAADPTFGDNFVDLIIESNHFWKNRYHIVMEVGEGFNIKNNIGRASKGSAIRLVNPRSGLVEGNQMYDSGTDAADPSRDGLVFADSPTEYNAGTHGRVVVKNNIIHDNQAVPTMQVALHYNSDKITADRIELEGNDLKGSVVRNIKDEGSTLGRVKTRNNLGFETESQGIATIPNGSTFVAFNHNLAPTPTPLREEITLWPMTAWGAATQWWGATSITGTTARVNVNINPGANVDFGFKGQKNA